MTIILEGRRSSGNHGKEGMTIKRGIGMEPAVAVVLGVLAMLAPSAGWAHCDTMNGRCFRKQVTALRPHEHIRTERQDEHAHTARVIASLHGRRYRDFIPALRRWQEINIWIHQRTLTILSVQDSEKLS